MRNQWRILHLHLLRSHKTIPNRFHSQLLPSFSSIPSHFTTNNNSPFPINPNFRTFTSESILTNPDSDLTIITNVFSKSRDLNDINNLLKSNNFSINHETLNSVLWKLDSDLVIAQRFFLWISENHPEKLSSKSYNAMLRVLGANGIVDGFWDLVDFMKKKKGYGVSKGVRKRVLECFQEKGLDSDVVKLNDLFNKNTFRDLCRIVRDNVWSDDVEKQIRDLNLGFSSEVVKLVLENLDTEPNKGLIFFRWVEESGMFKHDGCTYNVMARVLGKEDSDSMDRFWKLVGDMRCAGFEMESETFVKVLKRFCKKEMIEDAVKLYHFAMEGANKPSRASCNFLLRKVVSYKDFFKKKMIKDAVELYQVAVEGGNRPSWCKFLLRKIITDKREELDMELFSRVLKVYTGDGYAVTDSMATAILRSFYNAGRKEKDWNNIMKEMLDCGFVPSPQLQCEIVDKFGYWWYMKKTDDSVKRVEASGCNLDHRTFQALVEGLISSGLPDMALDAFKDMVEKEGVASAGYTFHKLMREYCLSWLPNRAVDASKILCQLVKEKELKPRHSTYKLLVTALLKQKGFEDALNILGLMRNHGYPPFTDPFIEHVSHSGSGDDAVLFLKATTSKRFSSTSVYLRMLEAFLKKGRHEEANNLLSKSPSYVRNHADVLNMLAAN